MARKGTQEFAPRRSGQSNATDFDEVKGKQVQVQIQKIPHKALVQQKNQNS